jgi:hypothetical protein
MALVDASSLVIRTDQLLSRVAGEASQVLLDDLSERLASQAMYEENQSVLLDALSEAQKVADSLSQIGQVSEDFAALIRGYLRHLNRIIESYELLGEQDFWEAYSVLFVQFLRQHEEAFGGSEKKKQDLQKMFHFIVTASSLTANVITIGSPFQGLLG